MLFFVLGAPHFSLSLNKRRKQQSSFNTAQVPPWLAVRKAKALLFCKTTPAREFICSCRVLIGAARLTVCCVSSRESCWAVKTELKSPPEPVPIPMIILWPYWIPCSCLSICLAPSQAFGNPFRKEKGRRSFSGCLLLGGGIVGPWVPVACSLPGCTWWGGGTPWTVMAACLSVVQVFTGRYSCCITIWKFICCILEETDLTRRLKIHGPKVSRSRKAALGPIKGVRQENQDQILGLKSHQSNPPEAPFI